MNRDPHSDPQAPRSAAAVTDAAALLAPFLPPSRRTAVADAVARTRLGHARVLVLGEAKRGKSTLVNALYGAPLLPTGAVPLTSVATVVRSGPELRAEVRHRDGRSEPATLDAVAALVTERGNPGNRRAIDRVLVGAPSAWLPVGTEVVDTPGTGSVHAANTAEARRALSTLDVAVLVVAADPPVSTAELDLLAEALTTAARAAVVVNKADLVRPADLAEVVDFTAHAVARRLGAQVPVFTMSALPGRSHSAGFAGFAAWLAAELATHGSGHAVASTRRLVRREAAVLRDALLVEEQLVRRRGDDAADAVAALSGIVDRADDRTRAALDHLQGDVQRLRTTLDAAHAAAVVDALAAAQRVLVGYRERPGSGTPEDDAVAARTAIGDATRTAALAWFRATAAELDTGVRGAVDRAVDALRTELTAVRRAARDLLHVDLSPVPDLPGADDVAAPSFEATVTDGWEELVATTLRRGLPGPWRRRLLHGELQRWRRSAVPRPFGRARAALQVALRESLAVGRRRVDDTRGVYLDALRHGLAAVRDDGDVTRADVDAALARITPRRRAVEQALALLAEATPDTDESRGGRLPGRLPVHGGG